MTQFKAMTCTCGGTIDPNKKDIEMTHGWDCLYARCEACGNWEIVIEEEGK